MSWHYYVMKIAAGTEAPVEWNEILQKLSSIIKGDLIDKIEVAAFAIRGERKARWLVDKNHSEFATIESSIGTAKKLTWLLLNCEGGHGVTDDLYKLLKCSKTNDCILLEGHEGNCKNDKYVSEPTTCPLCKEGIKLNDFDLDARTELLAIQMGHLVPLSKKTEGHNAQNVVWIHRSCNYIQDERTIKETVETLRRILEKHGYKFSLES